jgi:predicted transposase YdaD
MLGFVDQDLKQTRFYQDVFAEGLQEGERKEGIKLILRQLQRCCGELEPALRERVSRLSLVQLEALGEALLEFASPADLERWLQQHADSG